MEKTVFISGPEPQLDLVYSDVWLPGLYSRRVFVFELPATSSHEKAIDVLERALKALVLGTPELGSESVIVPQSEHDGKVPWRALKSYKGIELIVKDFTQTFPSFRELERRGFPLAVFKDRLLMPIPLHIEPEPQPQAKFQVSLIEGGILLSTCIYHHLTDGNGMNTITRTLGEACKLAAQTPGPLAPLPLPTDRTLMKSLHGTQTDLTLHPAHSIIPNVYLPGASHDPPPPPPPSAPPAVPIVPSAEDTPSGPPLSGAPPPRALPTGFVPAYFRLTSAKATALKVAASASASRVSTHDAITALLWRTLMRARHACGRLRADELSTYTFPHNARRYVGLPADWVGNCVYFCCLQTPVSAFVEEGEGDGEGGLAATAARIRGALEEVDAERVAGIMTLRRRDPYSLAWWPVGDPSDVKVLGITSFYQSGLMGIDWGEAWGPVRHFTTTDIGAFAGGFERTSFVGPKIGGGNGCDVLVGVDGEELEFFKKDELWNRFFEPLRSEPLEP